MESMDMSLSRLQETMKDREVWHAAVHGVSGGEGERARVKKLLIK